MANRWCDGFGRYGGVEARMLNGSSGSAWAEVSNCDLVTTNARTGTYCLHITANNLTNDAVARRVFGDTLTEVFFGQAIHFNFLPTAEYLTLAQPGYVIASFRSQANVRQVSVKVGTDGSIFVIGPGGTLLGRTIPIIGAGSWHHVEHYLKVGNGDGAYELRVDEVTRLNLTGIDTDAGAGEVSQVAIEQQTVDSLNLSIADCYVNDTVDDGSGCNDFIGDCKSGVRMVNADTAQADFTLSSGVSGYELLNEIPPDDADYIETSSTTAESNFGLEDGPASLTEILTVRPFVRAWKDDAGTAEIAPSMISNSVKETVSSQPITTGAAYYDVNVPLNPDTSAPWTLSEFDAALHVVERTS